MYYAHTPQKCYTTPDNIMQPLAGTTRVTRVTDHLRDADHLRVCSRPGYEPFAHNLLKKAHNLLPTHPIRVRAEPGADPVNPLG